MEITCNVNSIIIIFSTTNMKRHFRDSFKVLNVNSTMIMPCKKSKQFHYVAALNITLLLL